MAEEVGFWGRKVLKDVKRQTAWLYAPIPDPDHRGRKPEVSERLWGEADVTAVPHGFIIPIAYLWTRTVVCPNPSCKAHVPLVRQTWLCRRKGRAVALKMVVPRGQDRVQYEVVEAANERAIGF